MDYFEMYGDVYLQENNDQTRSVLDYIFNRWDVRLPERTLCKTYDETFDAELIERPQEKTEVLLAHFTQLFHGNVFASVMDTIVDDALEDLVNNGKYHAAYYLGEGLEVLVLEKLASTQCANIRKLLFSLLKSIYQRWYKLKAINDPLNYGHTLVELCEKYLNAVDATHDYAYQFVIECLKELDRFGHEPPECLLEQINSFFSDPCFIIKFSCNDVSILDPENVISEFLSYAPDDLAQNMIATCQDEEFDAKIAQEVNESRALLVREYNDITNFIRQYCEFWNRPNLSEAIINDMQNIRELCWQGEDPYLPNHSYLFWDKQRRETLLEYHKSLRQLLENPDLETILTNYIKSNIERLVVFLRQENAPEQ